ncbi:hypothetical protein ADUPG1_007087 [Aduncisulcus paluster]|uniref:Uncharacterized protein n=1 Tax=Aduncisulcus paluster TaxID=2918883 RepID=A0ABQ5KQ68_9EUKA|nr:hypothetical protein ADUPG1_007087 [Aduncisulcus paluster]
MVGDHPIDFNCHDITTCDECVAVNKYGYVGCGWCNDEDNQGCKYANESDPTHSIDDGEGTCTHWEAHDMYEGGTYCCITEDNCKDCVRSSWFGWCVEDEKCYDTAEDTTTETCDGVTEKASCCSANETCDDCKDNASCIWCVSDSGSQNCIKHDQCGGDGSTGRAYCCKDFDECDDCTDPSASVIDMRCVWCKGGVDGGTDNYCEYADVAEDFCVQPYLLGIGYCEDPCYAKGTMEECVADKDCVWLDSITYTDDSHPDQDSNFCMLGNMFGPKHQVVSFVSGTSTFNYPFNTNEYHWSETWMTNSAILGMFIALAITILGIIIVSCCIVKKRKLRKYKELRKLDEEAAIKAALAEAENGDTQTFDMSFLYTEVPWESEDEESSLGDDEDEEADLED